MRKISRMVVSIAALLIASTGVADEASESGETPATLPKARLLAETMLAELDYEARADLFHPAEATLFANESIRPIADVDFEDGSILSRFRKLRGVSFLTVAEAGDSRLFLGVNDDGIVGLHFGAFLRATGTRHLEFLRMPYLAEQE